MASPAPPSSPGVNGVVTADDRNDTVLFTDLSVEERLSRLEALSAEHAATLRGLFHALDTVDRRSLRQVTEFRTSFAEFRRLADEASTLDALSVVVRELDDFQVDAYARLTSPERGPDDPSFDSLDALLNGLVDHLRSSSPLPSGILTPLRAPRQF
ncbi:uncharacterized protein B0H18DRAFT_1132036 [Fomitopsis serialis]|uniref:uncharacterized protein n=1 Tax=Fomitopsis serialis TaxID=139415 RepID=UPI0020085009|nr:uncharacterized protein B0H18DRAFT_1132036 [Neoantrodia serialis]KAH9906086.1 hypothetical protein B0H18DRAFT_1132036 [Neoantrodia serialis]